MRRLGNTFVILGLAAGLLPAQSLENAVAKLGEAGAKAYMQPLVTGFGSNLNAGWFSKAPRPVKHAFHMSAGLSASGTLLGSAKTFGTASRMALDTALSAALIANSTATPAQSDSLKRRLSEQPQDVMLEGPTVTGAEGSLVQIIWTGRTVATGAPGDSVFIPADTLAIANLNGLLAGLNTLTFFAPQINVGTLYGTNLTLRWLPKYESREEIGPIDYFGFGFQHNPAVWLKPEQRLPVDLSVGYSRQALEGTFFKAVAWSAGLNVSKTYGWPFASATPYVGAQYEQSSFEVEYDLTAFETVHRMKTTIDGENTYRVTGGVTLRLLAINLNLDANYAESPSFSLGVMIGL